MFGVRIAGVFAILKIVILVPLVAPCRLVRHLFVLFVGGFLAIPPASLSAAAYRVDPFSTNMPMSPDGLTWTNAFLSVSSALSVVVAGDELWLKGGVYPMTSTDFLALPSGVSAFGGFRGTETAREQRKPEKFITVLDGQGGNLSLVVVSAGPGKATVDGFYMTNSIGSLGAGVNASGGDIIVSGNHFSHLGTNTTLGGALYANGGSLLVVSNSFENCQAASGAAIAALSVPAKVIANRFRDNSARAGSAIYASTCIGVVASNVFFQNTSTFGGTIDADVSSLEFRQNQFLANRAGPSGSAGITVSGDAIILVRNNLFALGAIVGATASVVSSGSALNIDPTAVALVWNNTFLDNDSRIYGLPVIAAPGGAEVVNNLFVREEWALNVPTNAPIDFRHNCFFRCPYPWPSPIPLEGQNGNFSADPLLAATPPVFQPRLDPTSPCRNTGENGLLAGNEDLDGNPRALDGAVDVGAFEAGDAVPVPPASRRFFVAVGGLPSATGLSWNSPFGSISNATALANPDFDTEIWVGSGTWKETIQAYPFLRIYGGFAGSETNLDERDRVSNPTIIDGRNMTNGVIFDTTGPYSLLDGFTIKRGAASAGAGIYGYASSPIVVNNTVTGNAANTHDLSVLGFGGGIAFEFGAPTLSNNIVTRNSAKSGGGIYLSTLATQAARLVNNFVQNNNIDPALSLQAQLGGAGIYIVGSASIDNNLITDNLVSIGPRGVNAPLDGAGLLVSAVGPCAIRNNNLLRNSFRGTAAVPYPGGGLHADGPTLTIVNNIIAGNTTGLDLLGANQPLVRSNLLFNNYFGNFGQPGYANVSLVADPLVGVDGLTLATNSPCIDSGFGPAVDITESDILGGLRWIGSNPDIGAREQLPAALQGDPLRQLLFSTPFQFSVAGGISYAAYDLGCLPCGAGTNATVTLTLDGAISADFSYVAPTPNSFCPDVCISGQNAAVFGSVSIGAHEFQVTENGVTLFRLPFQKWNDGPPLIALVPGTNGLSLEATYAQGLTYFVETSTNLAQWSTIATLSPQLPTPFSTPVPVDGEPAVFYRARTPH